MITVKEHFLVMCLRYALFKHHEVKVGNYFERSS